MSAWTSSRHWQRWSWDEIYTALSHERGLGAAFEVDRALVQAPEQCGAASSPLSDSAWDYQFTSDDGQQMYVRDLGDRYSAFLEPEGPTITGPWADDTSQSLSAPGLAAAGGFLVFLGCLWAVLEVAWQGI